MSSKYEMQLVRTVGGSLLSCTILEKGTGVMLMTVVV